MWKSDQLQKEYVLNKRHNAVFPSPGFCVGVSEIANVAPQMKIFPRHTLVALLPKIG